MNIFGQVRVWADIPEPADLFVFGALDCKVHIDPFVNRKTEFELHGDCFGCEVVLASLDSSIAQVTQFCVLFQVLEIAVLRSRDLELVTVEQS